MKYLMPLLTAFGILSMASGHGILDANEALEGWITLWGQVTHPIWDFLFASLQINLNPSLKDYLSISVISCLAFIRGGRVMHGVRLRGADARMYEVLYALAWPVFMLLEAIRLFVFFVSWAGVCAVTPKNKRPSLEEHKQSAGVLISYSLSLYSVAFAALMIVAASHLVVFGILGAQAP